MPDRPHSQTYLFLFVYLRRHSHTSLKMDVMIVIMIVDNLFDDFDLFFIFVDDDIREVHVFYVN